MRVQEAEETRGVGGGTEHLFKEILTKNFQNLGRNIDIQASESQRTLSKINQKIIIRQIIIKFSKVKDKERSLKAAREK